MLHDDNLISDEISIAERADIWTALSQIRYIFTHGLLRDAAYSMQMRARRMELHAIAVDALEKVYSDEAEHHYGELAYHAEQARLNGKALHYLREAGKSSTKAYQNSQGVDFYTRALAFVDSDDLAAQFDIVVERVELYWRQAKRDLQLQDLDLLERWAEQLNDPVYLAKVMMLRALYYSTVGNNISAVECSKRADAYLAGRDLSELAIKIQHGWSASLLRLGKGLEAMRQASIGLKLARESGRRGDQATVLTVMGLIALEQKDPAQAHAYLEESLQIAREMKMRRLEAYAVNNLALSEQAVKGNYALAADYYKQAYMISREIGDRYQEGVSLANLGWVAGTQGDFATAYLHHEHSLLVAREIGNIHQETYTLINLSAVAGLQKNAAQALHFATQAEELSRKVHDRSAEAWSLLYMGHAYLLLGDYIEALKAYQKSIDIRIELDQPSLSMEPIAGLAETALATGNLPAAMLEVEKIIAYLESGGSLDGVEEPLRVYHTCHQVLHQQKDPRAGQVLLTANHILGTQVSKFSDEHARKLFVENFPWRQAIFTAAKDL